MVILLTILLFIAVVCITLLVVAVWLLWKCINDLAMENVKLKKTIGVFVKSPYLG